MCHVTSLLKHGKLSQLVHRFCVGTLDLLLKWINPVKAGSISVLEGEKAIQTFGESSQLEKPDLAKC
jgi:hypothetical protein